MAIGYLSLILHAHLPFVRHPEYPDFLEEDWLYEAISETYIPLLVAFNRLRDEGVKFRLTMSMTPPLCEMLCDPLLQERYLRTSTGCANWRRKRSSAPRKKPRIFIRPR